MVPRISLLYLGLFLLKYNGMLRLVYEKERKDMLDIKLIRENKDLVKENIKKKFQDEKLPLVDEVVNLDKENRSLKQEGDELRASRNKLSAEVGKFMKEKNFEEADKIKAIVKANAERIVEIKKRVCENRLVF